MTDKNGDCLDEKKKKKPEIEHYEDGTASILRKRTDFTKLRFYHRCDVLYQLTQLFCQRHFKKYGDRTVDQMVQAARSTKQNLVEGSVDGQTSMESEIKLLGVARGSNEELLQDYMDYIKAHDIPEWFDKHPRFKKLHEFCSKHHKYEDYKDLLPKMNDEELANMAICLCHQVDSAFNKYIKRKDREFTTEGGIRERMTAARLEQRATQKETIEQQAQEIESLKNEIADLKAQLDGRDRQDGQ